MLYNLTIYIYYHIITINDITLKIEYTFNYNYIND